MTPETKSVASYLGLRIALFMIPAVAVFVLDETYDGILLLLTLACWGGVFWSLRDYDKNA